MSLTSGELLFTHVNIVILNHSCSL